MIGDFPDQVKRMGHVKFRRPTEVVKDWVNLKDEAASADWQTLRGITLRGRRTGNRHAGYCASHPPSTSMMLPVR